MNGFRGRPWLGRGGMCLSLLAAIGCGGGAPPAGEGGPPPTQVTAVTIEPRTVPVPYEFTGRLEGSREVEVRARVAGILLERRYSEGRSVIKGQTLFVIDPASYRAAEQQAAAEVAEERAQLGRAERDVARLEPLLAERAASRKDYDTALSDAEQARAALLSAQARLDKARLDLSYTDVTAPISGVSSRAEHSEGSLVSPGPGAEGLLTRISQVRPIWVRFSASDQTMQALHKAIAAREMTSPGTLRLEVELVLRDGTAHGERGQVNFSDPMIDTATGSIELRAELDNAKGTLVPGEFVRVRLLGIERPAAILVPQRAVQQGAQGKFVFVVDAEGKAQPRNIEVGDWLGSEWVIESGLAAGDRVLVDGVVKVFPGAAVQIVEPGAADAAPAPAT